MPRGMAERAELGRRAEALAALHLEQQGFEIVARNVRAGRLELDIIARRRDLVVFCEVRARRRAGPISPADTIDHRKIQRIRQAAAIWLRSAALGRIQVRFDAACLVFDVPGGRLTYYEQAFV